MSVKSLLAATTWLLLAKVGVFGQSSFYCITTLSLLYSVNHDDNCELQLIGPLLHPLSGLQYSTNDIAMGSDNQLYACAVGDLLRIDPVTGAATYIASNTSFDLIVALTGTSEGTLIAVDLMNEVFEIDCTTGAVTALGNCGYTPGGDLSFYAGELYMITIANELVRINLENVTDTEVMFIVPGITFFGSTTIVNACDEQSFYLSDLNGFVSVDIETGNTAPLCTVFTNPMEQILGATSSSEYLASAPCIITLDLDTDNSSGAAFSNYNAGSNCDWSAIPLADADCEIITDLVVDSLHVTLLDAIDGMAEAIHISPIPQVTIVSNNSAFVRIINTGGASTAALQQMLVDSWYSHDGTEPASAGTRTVHVAAFAGEQGFAQGNAHLILVSGPDAGPPATVSWCPGESASLPSLLSPQATPGGSWQLPSGEAFNGILYESLPSGNYTYIVNLGSCADTALWQVLIGQSPELELILTNPLCADSCTGLAQLIPSAGSSATFNNQIVQGTIEALCAGAYTVLLTHESGCTAAESFNLTEPEHSIAFTIPETACVGSPVPISYTANGTWEIWMAEEPLTADSWIAQEEGEFCLTAMEINGCATAEACLEVIVCPENEEVIYLPNSFTPNNDGINDVFRAEGAGVIQFRMTIHNRWGELLFTTSDFNQGWTGGMSETYAQNDVYVWRISAVMQSGSLIERTGHVTLMR
jgi:gliding motility-associated-like protein